MQKIPQQNEELQTIKTTLEKQRQEFKDVFLNTKVNRIFSVTQMSEPLIYATDNNNVWIL